MRAVQEYLRHAEECDALAAQATPEQREMITDLAQTWRLLAEQRARKLDQQDPH